MGICKSSTGKPKEALTIKFEKPQNSIENNDIQKNNEKDDNKPELNDNRENNQNKNEKDTPINRENRKNIYLDNSADNENNKKKSEILIDSNVIVSRAEGNPFEFYSKESKLGEGSFGIVYLARHKILTNTVRALKEIKKNTQDINKETELEIMNEINILKKMDHPNIVKIFEFYNCSDAFYLVTEFCKEGELFKQIIDRAPFEESFTAYIMHQIFSCIFYCHSIGVIHRDLKPENILIERKERNGNFRIKIIDFGTAKLYEKGKIERKVIGSSYYIAPEVLGKNYGEKCDLWSCGVIMYILLSARPPFGGENDMEIVQKIRVGQYDLSQRPWNKVSNEAKNLISLLLQKDQSKRISAEEALNHLWFKNLKTKDKLNEFKNNKYNFIQNLKNYKNETVLQSAALAYLVHNFNQMEEIQDACKLFNKIDFNGDGKITKDELVKGLKQFLSISDESLEDDVEKIFKNIDADNNGYIEFEEFVRAAIDKEKLLTEEILKFAFRFFDKDDSGEITQNEIRDIFFKNKKINDPNIQNQLKIIIQQVDINGDGKISFEEFCHMMRNIIKN